MLPGQGEGLRGHWQPWLRYRWSPSPARNPLNSRRWRKSMLSSKLLPGSGPFCRLGTGRPVSLLMTVRDGQGLLCESETKTSNTGKAAEGVETRASKWGPRALLLPTS